MIDPSTIHMNPRLNAEEREMLFDWVNLCHLEGGYHYFLTSGSTSVDVSSFKWVVLGKGAINAAANSSNRFLECSQSDIWLNPLPDFHVGGFSIYVRAQLSNSEVHKFDWQSWEPDQFLKQLKDTKATLTSLVPTQVFDLLKNSFTCPPHLRAILVGGGSLSDELFLKGRELGWPLLRTYGLTETCSQAATEPLQTLSKFEPKSQILETMPHLEIMTELDGRIRIRGESLFEGYILNQLEQGPVFWNPKSDDGWFITEDFGKVENRLLILEGRSQDRIKISGELVNLAKLRHHFELVAGQFALNVSIVDLPDERKGAHLAIAYEPSVEDSELSAIINLFNSKVMPYERITKSHRVAKIPRTALGKVKVQELKSLLK